MIIMLLFAYYDTLHWQVILKPQLMYERDPVFVNIK